MSLSEMGSKLLARRIISEDQLEIAQKEYSRIKGAKTIGQILIDMGFVSESVFGEILNEASGVKKFDIKSCIIDARLVRKVPREFAIQNKMIPVLWDKNSVTVAMTDVFDFAIIDQVRRCFPDNFKINPVYAPESDILAAIDRYYGYEMSIEGILKEIESSGIVSDDEEHLRSDPRSPMVRLVDAVFSDAIHCNASDIHFEPENLFLRIRYRIDGRMVQVRSIHKDYWSSIVVRIKIMSNMNIAETRKPQDGYIRSQILGKKIDFRVSTQPTIHGENIVIRILDEKHPINSVDNLGLSPRTVAMLKKMMLRPEGIIILTGPTGSGKTTTLYSLLSHINSADKNIMTLEDPVEYSIPMIRQSNIRTEEGVDFASGVRALLRQDPDVILIGEIRDEATASAAIQAAMTGHQVYTSLHTNDSIGSIPRLRDMKVPSYLLSGMLIGILAQRLVRKLCKNCMQQYDATDTDRKLLGSQHANITRLYKSVGCDDCGNSGYKGRCAVSEVIMFDRELDHLIYNDASRKEILEYILGNGFMPMVEDGIEKVIAGVTDLKELSRVVDMTDRL